jgi:DNA polymerase III sliding clamp (beta) subunit (PCNA family)
MGLEAKIKVPAFKNVLKFMKAIREESIIVFDEEGMSVRMVDSNRVRMIQVRIDSEGFSEYECDGRYELAVVLVRMDDIVKALTAKDDLRLRITDQDDGTFRFALLSNGMERGIKLLNMRLMEGQRAPAWPNFDYVFSATIPADGARSFLKAAKVANDFQISVEPDASGNGITWAIRDDREPLVWRPEDPTVSSPERALSLYSVEAVASLVGASVGKQDLRLRGGNDTPVEISWIPHDGIAMAALVANRG